MPPSPRPSRAPRATRPRASTPRPRATPPPAEVAVPVTPPPAPPPTRAATVAAAWERWLELGRESVRALDRMPPIRLPVGPEIPWRYGLPALLALVVVVAVLSRPMAGPVAADSLAGGDPLFAQQTGLGVSEPPGLGVDLVDLGVKLLLVLGLAYGSLLLLRRLGIGGAAPAAGALPASDTLRLLNSLTLAPNRSLHLVRAPGGKLLLVGSTPQQVNLIADLGERPDLLLDEDPVSFLQVLSSKIAARKDG